MSLPFLNRHRELARLRRALESRAALTTVYGRRRLGKSRLIREAMGDRAGVYYAGDIREGRLQREAFAREVARALPGFDAVQYPDWDALLTRCYRDAPEGLVVALDELPDIVTVSPELPSVLRRHVDLSAGRLSLIISGSSQSMMHSLVLDSLQPLYGRSTELMKIEPMTIGWLARALAVPDAETAVSAWSVFGGVPRYWELATGGPLWDVVSDQILDPLGPLYREPERLLRDEMTDHRRAASILSLIGSGSHRLSEIAGRMGVTAADLSRPLRLLIDTGFVLHEVPFGRSARDSKRTRYSIADPFLRFWFRFVEPNRSRIEAMQTAVVRASIEAEWPGFLGSAWEDLARASIAQMAIPGRHYLPAGRWWGTGHGRHVEIDIVARAADDPELLLLGEAKVTAHPGEIERLLWDLEQRASRSDELVAKRRECVLFVLRGEPEVFRHPRVIGPDAVIAALGGRDAGWFPVRP